MIIVLFLIGFVAVATAIGVFYATKAPIGYEDEEGFHYGWQHGGVRNDAAFVHKKTASPLIFLQLRWAKSGLGLAALFIVLLAVSPEAYENNENRAALRKSQEAELDDLPESLESTVIQSESSRLFQTLCQRFSQIE
jgi:hypothetical protein